MTLAMTPTSRFPLAGTKITVPATYQLVSPAFSAVYPKIINPHLLETDVRNAMAESWNKGTFHERPLEIFVLKNVFLSEECLVLDDDLRVIENVSDVYTEEEITQAVDTITRQMTASLLPHFRAGILSKRRAAGNFGHFLMEMLPMAIIGQTLLTDPDAFYILHRSDPPLQDTVFRAFRLMGINLNRLQVLDFHQPIYLRELVAVRGLTRHGTYMSPLAVQAVARLSENVDGGNNKKIFVRRVPGWKRGRSLLNEDQVAARLSARGFYAIEPGSMSLEQQISYFQGAEHVIGVAGAAMTNIVFCWPGTKLTMLASGDFPDTFFWFIATHKHLDYTEVRCRSVDTGATDMAARDFTMSEDDILAIERLDEEIPQITDDVAATSSTSGEPMPSGVYISAVVGGDTDIQGPIGSWIGQLHSGIPMKSFSLNFSHDLRPNDIMYRGLVGDDRAPFSRAMSTPWVCGGLVCGAEAKHEQLLGIAVRLIGQAAERFDCEYSATFVDGSKTLHCKSGELCTSDRNVAIESFQLLIRPKV